MGRVTADSGQDSGHLVGVGVGGIAAVKALADDTVLHLDRTADDGQRVEQAVVSSNTQGAAVGGSVQRVQYMQVGFLLRGAYAALEQAVNDQTDGVDRALGHGSVAALAPAADDSGAALPCFKGHALGLDKGTRADLHGAGCAVRHGIMGDAALKRSDNAVQLGADDLAVEAALFTVADRELSVRGEAERRHGVMLGVVIDVVHVGLLVGTQQGTHGVF